MADKHAFLSDEWFDAASKLIAEHGTDGPPGPNLVMNLEVTDGDKTTEFHMGAKDGTTLFGKGHTDGADLTLVDRHRHRTRGVRRQQPGGGMQAFMAGKVRIQGDMTKLMMAQAGGQGGNPASPKRCSRSPNSLTGRRLGSVVERDREQPAEVADALARLHRVRLQLSRRPQLHRPAVATPRPLPSADGSCRRAAPAASRRPPARFALSSSRLPVSCPPPKSPPLDHTSRRQARRHFRRQTYFGRYGADLLPTRGSDGLIVRRIVAPDAPRDRTNRTCATRAATVRATPSAGARASAPRPRARRPSSGRPCRSSRPSTTTAPAAPCRPAR